MFNIKIAESIVIDGYNTLHNVSEISYGRKCIFVWGDNNVLYETQEEISLRATSFPEDNVLYVTQGE